MSNAQRILHVISELDGYATTRQLQILAQAQLAQDHAVQIGALRAERSILDAWKTAGLRCQNFRRRWAFDPFAWRQLRRTIARWQPTVVHVWDVDAARNVSLAWPGSRKERLVASLPVAPTGRTKFLRKIDRIALPSEEIHAQFLHFPVDEKRLTVVPPAISLTADKQISKAEFLHANRLPVDAKLIITVGPLVRAKRLDEAIWHFELVRTLNESAALLVLGDGPERHRLERYARLVSVPAAIKFLGYCSDISSFLRLGDVLWHTGEEQGISAAVLESMAAGVPVVASDVPVNRGLIEPGKTGFLAAATSRPLFARHTLKLLEDSEHAARIGSAAAEVAKQRFAADRLIADYEQIYLAAANGQG